VGGSFAFTKAKQFPDESGWLRKGIINHLIYLDAPEFWEFWGQNT